MNGCIGSCLFMPMSFTLILGFIVLINLGVAISRNGWWIFVTIVVAFIVFFATLAILFNLLDECLKKYQLRKFLINRPPPSKGTTEEATDDTA